MRLWKSPHSTHISQNIFLLASLIIHQHQIVLALTMQHVPLSPIGVEVWRGVLFPLKIHPMASYGHFGHLPTLHGLGCWRKCHKSVFALLYTTLFHCNQPSCDEHNSPMPFIILFCLIILWCSSMGFASMLLLFYFCSWSLGAQLWAYFFPYSWCSGLELMSYQEWGLYHPLDRPIVCINQSYQSLIQIPIISSTWSFLEHGRQVMDRSLCYAIQLKMTGGCRFVNYLKAFYVYTKFSRHHDQTLITEQVIRPYFHELLYQHTKTNHNHHPTKHTCEPYAFSHIT